MSVKHHIIVALLVVHASAHAWYGEEAERVRAISELTVNRLSEEMQTPLYYIDTLDIQGEAGIGSGTTYSLQLTVGGDDGPKLCIAKLFENQLTMSHSLIYYDCQDSDFDMRDDIPYNKAEKEDDSDYEDCTQQDITDLVTRVGEELNKEVDDTNAEFDMPGMMDMGDLKQEHYEMKGLDSCLKKTTGEATIFKAKIKAFQNGVDQTCEIVLVDNGGTYELPKSQCQGQD